jgi:hypothetical protein
MLESSLETAREHHPFTPAAATIKVIMIADDVILVSWAITKRLCAHASVLSFDWKNAYLQPDLECLRRFPISPVQQHQKRVSGAAVPAIAGPCE